MNRRDLLIGSALVATTAVWGTAFTGIKILVGILGPEGVAVTRFLLAGTGFVIVLAAVAATRPADLRLTRAEAFAVLAAGVTGVLFYHLSLNAGNAVLLHSQSSNAVALFSAFLVSTTSFFTVLLIPFVTREHLGPRRVAGVLIGLAGTAVLLFWGTGSLVDSTSLRGMALILAAPISWAVYTVVFKRFLARVPFHVATSYAMVAGSMLLFTQTPAGYWGDLAGLNVTEWAWAILLGVFAVFAAYLVWGWGLTHWNSARVSSFVYLAPLFGAVVATFVGGETFTLQIGLGGLLILAGLYATNTSARGRRLAADQVPTADERP